jgi:hypothetical protein
MAPLTGYKVADLTALADIAPENRASGYMRSVQSEKAWYQFVEGDTTTASGALVVAPATGTGRWFKSNIANALEIPLLDEYIQDRVAALLVEGNNIELTYDDVSNSLTIAVGNLGSYTSETVVHTTSSLAAGASVVVPITVPNFCHAYRLSTSSSARVRVYSTEASATSDLARPISQELSGEHGCFLEVVTTSANLDIYMAPTAPFYRVSGESGVYLSCVNRGITSASITINLYIYKV